MKNIMKKMVPLLIILFIGITFTPNNSNSMYSENDSENNIQTSFFTILKRNDSKGIDVGKAD